ncbi:uncharacterized protein LOC116252744 [Nymphaea colorata]|nr:uncharacterized protein LOC116252744 [Nymphaea colorata]
MASLTDYEKTRLENIKRNQEKLASLNLNVDELRLNLQKRKEVKGYKASPSKKPKKENAPVVIRRSLRARGIAPDAVLSKGLDDDLPTPDRHQPSFPSSPTPPPYKRETPFSTKEVYEGKSDEGEFKKTVLDICETTPLGRFRGRGEPRDLVDSSFKVEKLRLKEENIARVVSGRILTVKFFPTDQRTVVVAGDKYGHVGFWDVDYGDEKEGGDGVYIYCPHSAPVSGITVQPFALSKVFTSGYDGFIRMMDIEEETFHMVYSTSEAIFSLAQCPNENKLLYFAEGSGELKIWDNKSGKITTSCHLHESRINSIDFHPSSTNLMLTSSSDGTACIWDLRNIKQSRSRCITTVRHERAIHSAYFSPTGSHLATTSYDNRVGLLRGTDARELKYVHHNNQTSRWISSFRAIWGWDDSYLFIGNTKRAVDVISTSSRTTTTLESSLMTAIPCRFAAHPHLPGSLAGGTGGGQVYLWTTG